jgi:tRNA threonylcarbamoyl adenosine modification protein YeaZ
MFLAVDTSQMTYSVALSNGWSIRWNDIQTTLYDQLQSTDISTIDSIIINIGPGRFSGLRSGIAFAQGLATARQLPIYPVSHFGLIAAQVTDHEFAVAIDARKDEAYLQYFTGGKAVSEMQLISLSFLPTQVKLYGNVAHATPIEIDAMSLIRLTTTSLLTTVPSAKLEPIYIRAST